MLRQIAQINAFFHSLHVSVLQNKGKLHKRPGLIKKGRLSIEIGAVYFVKGVAEHNTGIEVHVLGSRIATQQRSIDHGAAIELVGESFAGAKLKSQVPVLAQHVLHPNAERNGKLGTAVIIAVAIFTVERKQCQSGKQIRGPVLPGFGVAIVEEIVLNLGRKLCDGRSEVQVAGLVERIARAAVLGEGPPKHQSQFEGNGSSGVVPYEKISPEPVKLRLKRGSHVALVVDASQARA